jgi:signal transduction histidine kinase
VMANLRPPVLDDYGLVAALHWYREQLEERTGLNTVLTAEEPLERLPARIENALFRIAQEALTNVVKHARASLVSVSLAQEGMTLRLRVADDGIGFDAAETAGPDGRSGWGILTMIDRAEAVGARCSVESQIGQGTCVTVEVPL